MATKQIRMSVCRSEYTVEMFAEEQRCQDRLAKAVALHLSDLRAHHEKLQSLQFAERTVVRPYKCSWFVP
jgi:hypothetical protein